jgi:hypothetical protein
MNKRHDPFRSAWRGSCSSGLSGFAGFAGFAQQEKQDKPAGPLALLYHQLYALLFMPSLHTLPCNNSRRSMYDKGMAWAVLKK